MADLIYDEMQLFFVCLLLGAMLAVVYDVIRIIRLLFVHWEWIVDVEDLLYWIFTAWMVFRTLFYYNQGMLRGYAFLGMFLGVVVYYCSLSRLFLWSVKQLLPWWDKGKKCAKKPILALVVKIRKALKNVATEVTMAVKGR